MADQPQTDAGTPSSPRRKGRANRMDSLEEGIAVLARAQQMGREDQAVVREQIGAAIAPLEKELDALRATAEKQGGEILDKVSLEHRLSVVTDRLKDVEKSWSSQTELLGTLEEESEKHFHELERQRLVDEKDAAEKQRGEIQDKVSVEHRLSVVTDRLKELETSRKSQAKLLGTLEKESEKHYRELGKQQLVDEKNAEVWLYMGKVALPLLSAAVIALFAWVWNSQTALALLQNESKATMATIQMDAARMRTRIDQVDAGTGSRFTRDMADGRFELAEKQTGERLEKAIVQLRTHTKGHLDELSEQIKALDKRTSGHRHTSNGVLSGAPTNATSD